MALDRHGEVPTHRTANPADASLPVAVIVLMRQRLPPDPTNWTCAFADVATALRTMNIVCHNTSHRLSNCICTVYLIGYTDDRRATKTLPWQGHIFGVRTVCNRWDTERPSSFVDCVPNTGNPCNRDPYTQVRLLRRRTVS